MKKGQREKGTVYFFAALRLINSRCPLHAVPSRCPLFSSRALLLKELVEVVAAGIEGLEAVLGRATLVETGDGLVLAPIEGENGSGGGGSCSRGRQGRLRWGYVVLADRDTFPTTTAPTAYLDSFDNHHRSSPKCSDSVASPARLLGS